jgi:hypothetical protein
MDKDLNIRPKTLKVVQKKARNTLETIGTSKDFLNRLSVAQQLRERMEKWDFIKLESFCPRKEMLSKQKQSPTEWKKLFASYTSDKGQITRIYREIKKLNFFRINKPVKKWSNEVNRTKRRISNAQKTMKKCSPSLALKEMQIKTTLIFHLTHVRIVIVKTPPTISVVKDVWKKEPLYTAGGNAS